MTGKMSYSGVVSRILCASVPNFLISSRESLSEAEPRTDRLRLDSLACFY